MGFDAQDRELVRLLTKLKESDVKYPPDLLAARRQGYLKQMGELGLGAGIGAGIGNAVKGGKAPALSSATSTVLESALVVAIVAETGTVAYFYRDKLSEFFHTITNQEGPRVQEVSPSPVHTEREIQGVTPAPAVAATLPSANVVISPTEIEVSSTPIPDVVEKGPVSPANTVSAANATPAPKDKDNNGNHYGQTPKPERTKEPKNNNDNNDKPPKDNSNPPKDNSKPTKAK